MHAVLDWTIPLLPDERPRHLLGIGDVAGVFEAVGRGVDTFDCVMPTRNARTGTLLTLRFDEPSGATGGGASAPSAGAETEPSRGAKTGVNAKFRINLLNAAFANDLGPVESGFATATTCVNTAGHTKALVQSREQLRSSWPPSTTCAHGTVDGGDQAAIRMARSNNIRGKSSEPLEALVDEFDGRAVWGRT